MESLSYYLEARDPVFSENVEFSLDHLLSRTRNLGKDWDAKVLSDFVKDVPAVRSMEFVDTNLPNTMAESLLDNPGLGASSDEITDITSDTIPSASVVNFDPLMLEGCALRVSVTANKPHNQKDSTADPNLEKWTDSGETNGMPNSEENIVSSDSSLKKARTSNLHSQIPLCQVHGCYKDLSSSKDYHKRHRVCDVHSKTAKVIINGIEKRFCQQCSRFHLLTDFDDGKRSCRKRLAGHNERRRKPQLGVHLSPGFLDMTLMKGTSFLSPEASPAGFFYQEKFEKDNQRRHIKLVEGLIDSSQLAVPEKNLQSPHICLADQHIIKRPRPSGACTGTAAIAVELSAVLGSSSALSLLSAQSQNTSSDSADMSMALPHSANGVNQHAYTRTDQSSAKNLATSTLEGFSVNDYSFGTISQEGIPRVHDGSRAVSFKGTREGTFQESKYKHANRRPFPEVGTLDLLQLSSHLQRVEQQRNSLQVKHENETFYCSSAV